MTTYLHEERLRAVLAVIHARGARSVLDLGCGDGPLLARLAADPQIARVVGVEQAQTALERVPTQIAANPAARAKLTLVHGSLLDPMPALAGFDIALLIEVIEHIPPDRLSALERSVFAQLRPHCVIITTPNADLNELLGVPRHRLRHPDHRFEWGRAKFRAWAGGVAARHGHRVSFADIGGAHPNLGGASQMAVFSEATDPRQTGQPDPSG